LNIVSIRQRSNVRMQEARNICSEIYVAHRNVCIIKVARLYWERELEQ
jgi:hypothetical protein